MNLARFDALPAWAMVLCLGAHLAAGVMLGVLYFRLLWWTTSRFASGGPATTTIALMIGRFAVLGGVLTLASLEGALPLLIMALGVLIARSAVMRTVREATP